MLSPTPSLPHPPVEPPRIARGRGAFQVATLAVGVALAAAAARGALAGDGSRAGALVRALVMAGVVLAALLPFAWDARDHSRRVHVRVSLDVADAPVRIRWPRRWVGARVGGDDDWRPTAWSPNDVRPWSPDGDREDGRRG